MDKISTKSALEKLAKEIALQLNTKQDTLTFDSALSDTSKNPIKNKAVYDQYMTADDVNDVILAFDPDFYKNQYLTLRIDQLPNGQESLTVEHLFNINYATVMDISIDGGEWFTYNYSSTSITLHNGTTIRIRATQQISTVGKNIGSSTYYYGLLDASTFVQNVSSDFKYSIYGNILSLVYGDNFKGKDETLAGAPYTPTFKQFFHYLRGVVDVSNLILIFANNSQIYKEFFKSSNIINTPKLPAMTLGTECYSGMFNYCKKISKAPELPATTLANSCYYQMFAYTDITECPELKATNLAEYCYYQMFYSTKIKKAPWLPAMTLANRCYNGMFGSCSELSECPEILPATTLASFCYSSMFSRTALTKAPNLPATVAAEDCYSYMFSNCVSLTGAPVIALTTLAANCCRYMFEDCTGLAIGPVLAATSPASRAYDSMFRDCTGLTEATCMLTSNSDNCTYDMFGNRYGSGVSSAILYVSSGASFWSSVIYYSSMTTQTTTVYTVTAGVSPSAGGFVSGNGPYRSGQSATLKAIVNSGYSFVNWTRTGTQVSVSNPWTFTVSSNQTSLYANFTH